MKNKKTAYEDLSRTLESYPSQFCSWDFSTLLPRLCSQEREVITQIRILFDTYVGGRSAAVKRAPRASLGLTEGNVPPRASRGQAMLRVGSFQRMERSPAGW